MIKVTVNITDKQKSIKLSNNILNIIKKACRATLKFENFLYNAEIDVTIVDDNEIKDLNNSYRNIDKSTDVLSFPLGENGVFDTNPETNSKMLGDIVISIEHTLAQAELYGHSIEREIAFLTVHSTLHLLGYDHMTANEEKEMFEKQKIILNNIGLGVEEV